MCITVDELHARIYQFVVATAIGSAKGLFGKDLSAEERVFSMSVPADHSGQPVNTFQSSSTWRPS